MVVKKSDTSARETEKLVSACHASMKKLIWIPSNHVKSQACQCASIKPALGEIQGPEVGRSLQLIASYYSKFEKLQLQ